MLLLNYLSICAVALAAPHTSEGSARDSTEVHAGRSSVAAAAAAYLLLDDPSGSSIVSLKIGSDGSLSHPIKTPTGGHGSVSVGAGTGKPVENDALGSQGSVRVAGNMLFTVNAGSNTLSMFTIDAQNPGSPKLVGSPADTLGDFPISVDFSEKLNKACVLNGGARAGVTCYHVDPKKGLQVDGPLRALSKSIINETTPSNGPPGSAGQVLFNPDSTAVFATIKGNPGSTPVKLGSLVAWPVENDGCISDSAPIVTQIKGIVLDFGFQFLSKTQIFLADPFFGVALLNVGSDFKATLAARTVLKGEVAVCWTQHEPQLKTLYTMDAGQNLIYTLDDRTLAPTGNITVHGSRGMQPPGVFDSTISNGKMYTLAGTAGIFVIDLAQKQTQQFFETAAIGDRQFFQGMAVWPSLS